MNNVVLTELKNELKEAVSRHYKLLAEKFPEEDFYGYSLYTDGDVSSIGPVANRTSALTVEKTDPTYIYYRYSPDEWSNWDDFGLFEQVNKIIRQYYEEMKNKFVKYKKDILGQALQALLELEAEGLFGSKNDNRFIVIWLSDDHNEIINTSAKKLNTRKVYEEYASEFE